ncbi:MAG: CoA-acylating methylmalonate-semialdehyde dehydrogenase [Phycisphaerae bacterium]|nr:CoA-acylating methylmalonate-semialdehyde dehydrogenase [Phycisphaerae bacterium]
MIATGAISTCKLLIGGEWVESGSSRFGLIHNPSLGEVIARVPFCDSSEVDRAVRAAHAAFAAWRETPVVERARIMFRYKQLLEENLEDVARLITREHGKTLEESRASMRRGIEVVEFACGIPNMIQGRTLQNLAADVDCETYLHPVGVCVGITPFNFPAMVPMWMFPIAVTCGNTFILKPSERVPLSAIRIVELLLEAGLPKGVISIVHGDRECVDALLTHPLVRAISFVGSTRVAHHIYTTGTAHGKRVQANGGAKNHLIIMPDADIEKTVAAVQSSAFGCAGERCMAGSLALPVGAAAEPLVRGLVDSANRMKVGRTDTDAAVDMGPLITKEHLERVSLCIEKGRQEGATLARDGRGVRVPDAPQGFYLGPTIIDHVRPGMFVAEEEIFGPVLSVLRVGSLDEAVEIADRCPFGNGAVIYTRSGYAARQFKHRFNAGMIGINVGVPAPMALFSFTGWNASFFGDLHIQGPEAVRFYTQEKVIMTRWHESGMAGGEFVVSRG